MNDIVQKIKKLLSLASSANEHESKLAAEKAQELLLKHNLDMQEVNGINLEYFNSEIGSNKRMDKKTTLILSVLESCYFITYYWRRSWAESPHGKNKIFLYGTSSNVEVATYVFNFLSMAYPRLWNEYKSKNEVSSNSRDSYYLGLSQGIVYQLKKNQRKIEDERGLVLTRDPELTKKHDSCNFVKRKPIKEDDQAVTEGFRSGSSLRISQAIESNPEITGLLIEGSV